MEHHSDDQVWYWVGSGGLRSSRRVLFTAEPQCLVFASAQIWWMNEKGCFLPTASSLDSPVLMTDVPNRFPSPPSLNAYFLLTTHDYALLCMCMNCFLKSYFLFLLLPFFPLMLILKAVNGRNFFKGLYIAAVKTCIWVKLWQ